MEIEERAGKIIESAEKARIHEVGEARKRADKLLCEAEASARREAEKLIEDARAEAGKEKLGIEKENLTDIEALRKKITPKLSEAKKLCR